jgi:IclR family acetate operon transcriptional repressor
MHSNRTLAAAPVDTSVGVVRSPRALEIVELLAFAPATAPEVAAALGIHPRSARRHLRVLSRTGWASCRPGRVRRYRAGVRPLAALWQLLRHHPLLALAAPVLAELGRDGAVAELAVPAYDVVLALRPTRAGGWHVRPLPPHATAAGKLLLAHRDDWRRRHLAGPLDRHTAATLTDARRLGAELDAVRRRGYALERGEHATRWRAIAVPLPHSADPDPAATAAISVGGDGLRLDDDLVRRVAAALRSARG